MTPATLRLDAGAPRDLEQAAEVLRAGGLVAFPTETVYGLGALALDPLAVRAIYAAKGRPPTNPVIVHVPSALEARALCAEWPVEADLLAAAFWPGPLTLVLPRAALIPDEITAGGPTVAVRAPGHPVAQALLARVGAPLAAPSANRSEHVSPTLAAHALGDLEGRIDAVLDGGPCAFGIESTVLSLAHGAPRILRAGAVDRVALEALLGPIASGPAAGPAPARASPGQHSRHYAPAGEVALAGAAQLATAIAALASVPGAKVGALVRTEAGARAATAAGAALDRLPDDAAAYARRLYAALRALEGRGCAAVAIEEAPGAPEWEAVRDRLFRAAGSPATR